ncbi:bifunctional NMN adenylyltransferase/nudix hydrolase [Variovorax sp. YR216]|nr:bifunctional NMN adenylyltransferase/nudix hydrolase [Variovorax sp. YR216]
MLRILMTASISNPHDLAVLIGRFQPFHNGHLSLLKQALVLAPRVVVVIGSAFGARSPKLPFDWQDCARMIRAAVPESERARILCVPVRDYFDEARWVATVRRAVAQALAEHHVAPPASTVLLGHFRDPTRDYLGAFPDWTLHTLEGTPIRRASALRDAVFAHGEAGLAEISTEVPPGTVDFLREWSARPSFENLRQEAAILREYDIAWSVAPYPPVLVTVDCVVKCGDRVLVIQRGHAPGKGLLAVPGGFLEQRETTFQSALRELEEETHLDVPHATLQSCLKGNDVFDRPDRSQRGRTITHGFFFDLGDREPPSIRADDDAAAASWMPIDRLCASEERFLDDHFQMLDHYLALLPR